MPRSALTAMKGCASPSSVAPTARADEREAHGRVEREARRVERAAGGGRTSQLWYRTRDDVRLVAHHHHGQRRVAHDGLHLLHVLLHVGAKRLGERRLPHDHAEPHLRERAELREHGPSTKDTRAGCSEGGRASDLGVRLECTSTGQPLGRSKH